MTHQAAWLKSKGASLEVEPTETPTPGPGELFVRVKVINFSPIESKLQRYEVHPVVYPGILGFSFAGIVEAVGPDVKGFAKGDRIASLRPHDKMNEKRFGGFQQFALASVNSSAKLSPDTPLELGGGAIANLSTIAAAFAVSQGLERPVLKGEPKPKNEKILVFGGSSSAGSLAISYLKAAGYAVVTTSSPKNHDFVASLSPDVVIDHSQAQNNVVADLRANGPYFRIFDTIGVAQVTEILGEYISTTGGGEYHTLLPQMPGEKRLPDNVQRKFESYGVIIEKPGNEELRDWFYNELVPEGLASGRIKHVPAEWIHGGLEKTQHALDLMGDGKVSGRKLALDPWA